MSLAYTEVIVKVGGDGGAITLVRARVTPQPWRFWVTTDESSLASIFEEEDLAGPLRSTLGPRSSWQAALKLLDTYRAWPFLHPLALHPSFRDRVLAAVRERGGSEAEARWVAALDERTTREDQHP